MFSIGVTFLTFYGRALGPRSRLERDKGLGMYVAVSAQQLLEHSVVLEKLAALLRNVKAPVKLASANDRDELGVQERVKELVVHASQGSDPCRSSARRLQDLLEDGGAHVLDASRHFRRLRSISARNIPNNSTRDNVHSAPMPVLLASARAYTCNSKAPLLGIDVFEL